jgi:hypothetical protein
MKLKIVLLALIGAAGATSSFALADSGHHGRGHENGKKDQTCKPGVVFGTASAPQSFTVTVTHAERHSSFQKGDVVTISLGTQGQTVAVSGVGCANGSTLQAGMAVLHVRMLRTPPTTTVTTTHTSTTGDRGKGHGHHDPHGGTTGTTTTSDTTTTSETSTGDTTTTSDTTTSDTTTSDTTTSDTTTTTDGGGL